jgi:hypothetical protein
MFPFLLSFTSSLDPNVSAFASAAGISDTTTINALNYLAKSLKGNNLWNKFVAIYPMVGGTSTSTSYNLINTATFQLIHVNSPTIASTGITYNGTTQYSKTGINPATSLTLNNTSLHFYGRLANAGVNGRVCMGSDAGGNQFNVVLRQAANTLLSSQYDSANGRLTVANSSTQKLFVATRTSSTAHKAYRDGASLGSNATSGGVLTDNLGNGGSIYIGARSTNTAGAAGGFDPNECAFAGIGSSVTSGEVSTETSIVNQFQTMLSRQV